MVYIHIWLYLYFVDGVLFPGCYLALKKSVILQQYRGDLESPVLCEKGHQYLFILLLIIIAAANADPNYVQSSVKEVISIFLSCY